MICTTLRAVMIYHCFAMDKKTTSRNLSFFGWGIGIRTPTNRVRVCRATLTQFPNVKLRSFRTLNIIPRLFFLVNGVHKMFKGSIALKDIFRFFTKEKKYVIISVDVSKKEEDGMKKKIAVGVGAIILILALGISAILVNGHYFKSKQDVADYENNNWMAYLKDDTLLNNIILPGSHDAGTCNMNYLGRTQGYPVETQLKMGARYFDLRVNKTEDGYYMYHAIFNGEKFEDVLEALSAFLQANPSETLILDFQHFKGECQDDVLGMLEDSLVRRNLAVKNESEQPDLEFVSSLRLEDTRGKCVILFGDRERAEEHNFLFTRNNDECTKTDCVLNSCYISEYNKMGSEDFIATALPYYYQNIKEKIQNEDHKGLFVLQGQLTDGYLIFGPYSKEKRHGENMSEYIRNIKNDEEHLALTNIIMRDFLTTEKCEEIIALNLYKGTVKEDFQEEFRRFAE